MASAFLLQVVDKATGEVVQSWEPGLRVEQELVNALCDRVQLKGVGLGRGRTHVLDDVRSAFNELLHDLKSRV